MLPSVSFSDGSLATVFSLGFAGHTLSAFSSLYSICFSLIYALDTVTSLHKARGRQHRPGPTLPPFLIHAPFPTLSPCSYLITEVLQFESLGLILDPKLTVHLATTEAIRRTAHGQSVTQAVSYSLRYD